MKFTNKTSNPPILNSPLSSENILGLPRKKENDGIYSAGKANLLTIPA